MLGPRPIQMMDDNAQRCLTDGSEAVSTMLPLRRFVATVFEPDLSVSTQWIPINECLITLTWQGAYFSKCSQSLPTSQ